MTKKSKDVRLKQLLRLGICVALIALIALVGAVMVSAEEPEYSEGLKFTPNGDGTCYVSGIGSCTDTVVNIPPTGPKGDAVTSIGTYAFYNCTKLVNITIPEGVTSIGACAFYNCTKLANITIPEGVTSIGVNAFFGCSGLIVKENGISYVDKWAIDYETNMTNAVLRSDTVGIADGAFEDCYSLSSVTIPEGVTSIGSSAFSGCSALTSITIPEGVTSIGNEAFSFCSSLTSIAIPNSVTSIGDGAFYHCSNLTSIAIPNGVTSIGSYAFSGCSALTSITIPEGVTSIGEQAFWGSGLTNIALPNSVTSIGTYAFSNCTKLVNITIPEGVTSIGTYAFYNCTKLANITIPEGVTSIGDKAFFGCSGLIVKENGVSYVDKWAIDCETNMTNAVLRSDTVGIADGAFEDCYSLSSVTIPEGVTSIGAYAFLYCTKLTSIIIPKGVTSIGDFAFSGCSALTNITIPEGVTSIGEYAFFGSSLTNIAIPNSVTSIGNFAFSNCSSLTSIAIPNSVTSIDKGAFEGCSSLASITIPEGVTSIDDFAFSGCSSLTSITIPESVTSIGGYVFRGCSALTSVTIPEGVTSIGGFAFSDCSALTSITIPEGVTSIGYYAFSGCFALTSITIPEGVTSIGGCAFYNCTKLANITIPEGVTSIGDNAFFGCSGLIVKENGISYVDKWAIDCETNMTNAVLRSDTVGIADGAFKGCYSLSSVTIPEGVTRISSSAFSGCSALTSITIPEGVTSIGEQAFFGSGLTNIAIPNSVTSIGGFAFSNCSSLTSVTIPDSVTSISYEPFAHCDRLADIYFGGTKVQWKAITNEAYNGPLLNATIHYNTTLDENGILYTSNGDGTCYVSGCKPGFRVDVVIPSVSPAGDTVTGIGDEAFMYASFTTVQLPETLKTIGNNAFSWNYSLRSIRIPASVTSIGTHAFGSCEGLRSLILPEDSELTVIGQFAFYWCYDLNSITIPKNVTAIGDYAFSCALEEIVFAEGSGLKEIGRNAFECCSLQSITLPSGLTVIGDQAFTNCYRLTSINIPQSVASIGREVFLGCAGLLSITVEAGNEEYYSEDHCLIHTASKTLLVGCANSKIPDDGSITHIADSAFYESARGDHIVIPKGVTSIGDQSFYRFDLGGSKISGVFLPAELMSIGSRAFGFNSVISDVYYAGTKAEWAKMVVEDGNDCLFNATIHYLGDLFDLTSASLTLGTSLTMNYYAKADPAYGTPAMRFTYRGKTETVPGVPTETEGEYVFSLTGIAPQCMGETIKAELILTLEDGTELVVDTKASYSVREYCDDALAANPDNKALATLLADLLAYGDAAQDYTGFNADTPVSEGFAAAPSKWEDVTDTDFTLSDKTRDDIRFTAAGVRFAYVNRLYFKLKAADLTGVTLTVNGKTYTAEDLALVEDTADTYIFYTDAVYATEFDKVFTAELSADGEVIQTLTYSVRSYVYAKQNSENTEMAALVRALYTYGRSAVAYKNEQ